MSYYNRGQNRRKISSLPIKKKENKKQVWENSSTSSSRGDGEFAVPLHSGQDSGSKSSKTGKIEILFSFQDLL